MELLSANRLATAVEEPVALAAGIFLIDKPAGFTSFNMVRQVRRALDIRKVGHAGTLDPFASGLLVVCAGRPATRVIPRLMSGVKEYEATLQLGIETETQDPEGKIISRNPVPVLKLSEVESCLAGFKGLQLQTPPSFSALKHKGKPLYYYARRGIKVNKEARTIEIMSIRCVELGRETLSIRVICSKGTYVRTLAADIGRALGCGAYLKELRRLRSGPFSVADCINGADLFHDDATSRRILLGGLLGVEKVCEILAE